MEPTKELLDDIYRERVLRARRMSLEEKFLAGPQLFELACQVTMAGIREQYPDADESRVQVMLAERIALRQRLEEFR